MGVAAALAPLAPASAELTISQLVVELQPKSSPTADIEIFNDSPERSFVAVEPGEIIGPGTPGERRFRSPDPEKLGILASPARLVLEPYQRKTLRIATIVPEADKERVYRVTVKPVAGEVTGNESGLRLLVGYDLLVLVRPKVGRTDIAAVHLDDSLTLTNNGNSSAELADGMQCEATGDKCQPLPSKRLYAGASWRQPLARSMKGEYRVRTAGGWSILKF